MTTTKQYDYLNRLTQITSVANGGTAPTLSFSYAYNSANQRTRRTESDSSYWVYTYESLGQVTSGKKYWSDGIPVAGQQFEYAFDDIGNRTQTKSGGDAVGADLRAAPYTANSLNQYTSRHVPGYVDVLGLSIATNTVTVNGQTAYRKGEYFRKELSVDNSSAALWTNITVEATGQTSTNGYMFVAKTNEVFGYDLDGNLTNDGRWLFTWDAENRLTKVESLSSSPTASKRKVTWEYDGKGRRIRQTDSVWNPSTLNYEPSTDTKFVNDGWRCLTELNATNNSVIRRYAWGLDVSGSMDGAGGVGGLLWMKAGPAAQFCAYDGNGNVVGMVRGSDGLQTASYEYDPFGQTIRMTGVFAKSNPFRFSTKRTDNTTDFVLYEYRIYKPATGSWLNRDPLGERGGANLYGIVDNNPVNHFDVLGLQATPLPVPPPTPPIFVLPPPGTPLPPNVILLPKPGPPPIVACTAAFAAGCVVGTAIDQCTPVHKIGPWVGDLICPNNSGVWQCTARCNVQAIGDNPNCPDRVSGNGMGLTEDIACRNAKREATQSTPPGCYPRHCRCICVKLR